MPSAELTDIERWFLARGIPHFIADYNASTRVWTRAIPFLAAAYLLAAIPATADSWRDAGIESATSLACLVATWLISNVARRRPTFSRPTTVGPVELAIFVLGPALAHLLSGEPSEAAWAMVVQLAALAVAWMVTSYAMIPLLVWTMRRSVDSLRVAGVTMARALPMLLLVVTFFFLTAETWQVFARLRGLPYGFALLLFVVLGSAFAANRAWAELDSLEPFEDADDFRDASVGTPTSGWDADAAMAVAAPELTRRQRINLMMVIVINQVLLSLIVAGALGLFFLAFGFLAIDGEVIQAWIAHPATSLWSITISDRTLVFSEELVRVSGFLATFSAFYFAVNSATDTALREGLGEFAESNLRQLFAVRQAYLAGRAGPVGPAEHSGESAGTEGPDQSPL